MYNLIWVMKLNTDIYILGKQSCEIRHEYWPQYLYLVCPSRVTIQTPMEVNQLTTNYTVHGYEMEWYLTLKSTKIQTQSSCNLGHN